jgi:guanosine-3',5'-bis(diphosphate) 3'-pyrophosphohydrolase
MAALDVGQRRLLEAISFASRAHHGQFRKDGKTPYASHPFRVCLIVRHLFGIEDTAILTAAVLHDTIEDTPTDYDDLAERYGDEVASWVGLLSKDMRVQEDEREKLYKAALSAAPWQVKVCKLGDIYDNISDSGQLSPEKRRHTCERSRGYLAVLNDLALPPAAVQAYGLVNALLQETEAQPG